MTDPVRLVSVSLPLRVVQTCASFELRDNIGRSIHLYIEDDAFRRSASPRYWRSADGRALAVWIARKLTDAIESGELVAVDHVGLEEGLGA